MDYFRLNGYYTCGSGKLMHHLRREEWCEFKHAADYGPFAFDGENRTAHPSVRKPFFDIGPVDGSFASLDDPPYADDKNPASGWIYGDWKLKDNTFRYNSPTDRDPTPDERNAQWAADKINRFAAENTQQPFFLGIGFIRPHTPLHVPQKYFDKFPLDELALPEIKDNDAYDTYFAKYLDANSKGLRYFRDLLSSYCEKGDGLRRFTQAYLASVSAVDECIGQVVAAVDESPLKENTIIVLTSDHGWTMGQKEFLFKNSPWEESTRVPLIIRVPGITKAGGVAEHPVSLIDLYPTLKDLCGLKGDNRKTEQGAKLDGHSLRPFLENPKTMQWQGPEGALTMIYNGPESLNNPYQQHWALRTLRWRYIRYSGGDEELYDHDKDPHEWNNLASQPEYAEIKKSLYAKMRAIQGDMQIIEPPKKASFGKWDWFKAIDTNRDQKITMVEWLHWSKNADQRNDRIYNKQEKTKNFHNRDKNDDGYMSRAELESK